MKKHILLLCVAVLAFASCSKDDNGEENKNIELNETSLSLYSEQTFQLQPTTGNGNNITWSSENKYVATVSSYGLVEGQRIGTAIIKANNASCEVTVKPRYNLYTEPYMGWGATKSEVKAKCGNYPKSETSTSLIYQHSNLPNATHPLSMYSFENGKLTSSAVVISTLASSQLTSFLLERYLPVSVNPEGTINAMFVNGMEASSITLSVGLSLYDVSYWIVIYVPASIARSGNPIENAQKAMLEILNNQQLSN